MQGLRCLVLALGVLVACASAEFVLYDAEDTMHRNWPRTPVGDQVPENWYWPIDYVGGRSHSRYEVLDYPRPDEATAHFLFGVMQGSHEGMYPSPHVFRGYEGPIHQEAPTARIDWKHIDLGRPLTTTRVQLLVYVEQGDAKWHDLGLGAASGPGIAARYLPFRYRLTVVVVAAGGVFSGWDAYPIPGRMYGGITVDETLRPVPAIARAIAAGRPGEALALAHQRLDDGQPAVAAAAAAVDQRLRAFARGRMQQLEAGLLDDPVGSVRALKQLAADYRGSEPGDLLRDRLAIWRKREDLETALTAHAAFERVAPAANRLWLALRDEAYDPDWAAANRAELERLVRTRDELVRRAPDSRPTGWLRDLLARVPR